MLKGSTPAKADVFNDLRHSTGKASIKETSLKASNDEIFSFLNVQLLLTIRSLLLEIRSPFSGFLFLRDFRQRGRVTFLNSNSI